MTENKSDRVEMLTFNCCNRRYVFYAGDSMKICAGCYDAGCSQHPDTDTMCKADHTEPVIEEPDDSGEGTGVPDWKKDWDDAVQANW